MIQLLIAFGISAVISLIWVKLLIDSKDAWRDDKDSDFP